MPRSSLVKPYIITSGDDAIKYEDTLWDDIRVPVSATRKPSAGLAVPDVELFMQDSAGTSTGIWCDAFDASTEESVLFEVQVPHAWKQESSLHLHVHHANSDSAAGATVWGAEIGFAEIGETFGTSTIYTSSDITAGGSAGDHKHVLTEIVMYDMAGVTSVSPMFVVRLFRDATNIADTYGSDTFLLEADFHMEIDRPGSRHEYIK